MVYSKLRVTMSRSLWIYATREIPFLFVFTSTLHWHRNRWNILALLRTLQQLLRNYTAFGVHLVPVLTKGRASGPPRCVHCLQMPKPMCIVQPSPSNLTRPCKQLCSQNLASHVSFTTGKNIYKQPSRCYIHPRWTGIIALCFGETDLNLRCSEKTILETLT